MRITSIRDVLTPRRLVVIAPERMLEEAFDLMEVRRVTALAVTLEETVQGIICARDIIRHASQQGGLHTTPVEAVMTREVRCAETRDCLTDICRTMRAGGFSHMPVLDLTGRLVGMLHRQDIPPQVVALAAQVRPAAA